MIKEDKLIFETKDGKKEEVELILTYKKDNKMYLLYLDPEQQIYASYIYLNSDDETLHNDLTEEEYQMLESLYAKGRDVYDK